MIGTKSFIETKKSGPKYYTTDMKHIEKFKVSQLKSVEEKEQLLKSVELNIDFENHLKPDFYAAETVKKTGKCAQQ